MVDTTTNGQAYQQFCGEGDQIKAGKACENCTCGKKEYNSISLILFIFRLEEGRIT